MMVFAMAVALGCTAAGAYADEDDALLPDGLTPHMRDAAGGRVDWTGGYILARGEGRARGVTDRDRAMAKRAAELVAARNALAIASGLPIDGRMRFVNIRNGQVRLQGVVKGHKTVSEDWRPEAKPPTCVVEVRVPLWGVKGVASVVYTRQCRQNQGVHRHALTGASADVSDVVLVIDARGMDVEPCLFPVIAEPDGNRLYDVSTMSRQQGQVVPPLRYAETTMTYSELRAARDGVAGESPLALLLASGRATSWAMCRLEDPATQPATQPATSQPTSKPDNQKRQRRRRVVKAVKTPGPDKTRIVLTKEDAERLSKDPEGASLLRSGQVVVVVDSVAAGIEGRLNGGIDDRILALRSER
jgi:hypothetical protein